MKSFSSTQKNILHALESGASISGAQLGQHFGISRTAIWKHIQTLIELGVPICASHQGYSLDKPRTFLNLDKIQSYLCAREFTIPTAMYLFHSIDSTNDFLKKETTPSHFAICCAEQQTHGRGRFNRHWISPFAEHVYVSFKIRFEIDLSLLSGLSLCIGLAIIQTLRELGVNDSLWIKWPNDVFWQDKKLSGTLIEVNAESHAFGDLIIGVGLNVGTIQDDLPEACALDDIMQHPPDRNQIVAELAIQVHHHVSLFLHQGLLPFIRAFEAVDYLKGKSLSLSQGQQHIMGTGFGINERGQLLLIDNDNQLRCFSTGDTSVKIKRPGS